MVDFEGKILIVGFGGVARCTLPILRRHVNVPPEKITVMDFEDVSIYSSAYVEQGIRFVQEKIEPENLGEVLGRYLDPGDLFVDLAWNIDCCELLQWCHDHGVLYVNTSIEVWDPYTGAEDKHPTERTLYWRHMSIRRLIAGWDEPGPTAVLEHGANPGLISHWTHRGLMDIAEAVLGDKCGAPADLEEIEQYRRDRTFNKLAMKLGVKTIHCSERDTQITNVPKAVDEFVNTWSVEGFREEGTTTAEMGWGTHEKELPALAYEHADGPRNQICLARMGMNTWVRSWVPDYRIRGMVVRHGEAFTISDSLTVWDGDRAVYRPTVHYAYCPCDAAIVSLHELRGYGYELQPKQRILGDDITSGSDILGALLMGHAFTSWWVGSDLSIEQARRLVPHQNATTMQVAISVVAATMYMIQNPARGVLRPDDLPYDYVLGVSAPYLGHNLSVQSDWTPLDHALNVFPGYNSPDLDLDDPWQFKNFLITQHD